MKSDIPSFGIGQRNGHHFLGNLRVGREIWCIYCNCRGKGVVFISAFGQNSS
jgi:hypothetical protein